MPWEQKVGDISTFPGPQVCSSDRGCVKSAMQWAILKQSGRGKWTSSGDWIFLHSPPGPLSSITSYIHCSVLYSKYHKLWGCNQQTFMISQFQGSGGHKQINWVLPSWNQGVSVGLLWCESKGPSLKLLCCRKNSFPCRTEASLSWDHSQQLEASLHSSLMTLSQAPSPSRPVGKSLIYFKYLTPGKALKVLILLDQAIQDNLSFDEFKVN